MIDIEDIADKEIKAKVQKELSNLENRAKLAAELNNASIDQILAIDIQKNVIACNHACAHVWDVDNEQVLGLPFKQAFARLYGCSEIQKAIESALRGFKYFVPAHKADYGKGYFEHHFVPLKSNDGLVTGVLIVIHDVAHRVKAENELKQLNRSLARKNKEIKQRNAEILSFSKVTAHDLKEPLRKMYLFIEMILRQEVDNLTDSGKENFKRIQGAAHRMSLLTDDIMAFAQLQDFDPSKETIDLNEIVALFQKEHREQIIATHAIINCDKLPLLTGYKKIIQQLFQHILANAIKFQAKGSTPQISIYAAVVRGYEINHPDAVDEARYHRLSFTDNGIGIDKKYNEKIFQMFQRLHTEYPGTGLGLALCKKIAELHQGFITVDSQAGQGSTFNCYFPINIV